MVSNVCLGDVATEVRETTKNSTGMPVVGLEHLVPGEIELSQWAEDSDNTFTKVFRKGQVLFGRRRAYQKKASVATIDGVCSGDITVIKAREEKLLPELLPFIVNDDRFFDFAMEKSAGSLSPRVKWAQLAEYSFELPESIEKQRELASLLWAIEKSRKAYKELEKQADDLVKSQFVEMFGDQKTNPKGLPSAMLGEVCTFYTGTGFPNDYQGNTVGKYAFFKVGDISKNVQNGNKWLKTADNYVDLPVVEKIHGTIIPPRTVVFAKIGEALRLNRRAITSSDCLIDNNAMGIQPTDALDLEYFFEFMKQLDMGEFAGATAMPSVRKTTLEKVRIIVPPMEQQQLFGRMAEQTDKSKYERLVA